MILELDIGKCDLVFSVYRYEIYNFIKFGLGKCKGDRGRSIFFFIIKRDQVFNIFRVFL